MAIAKEQLRQIISENDISSVGDIYSLFNHILRNSSKYVSYKDIKKFGRL